MLRLFSPGWMVNIPEQLIYQVKILPIVVDEPLVAAHPLPTAIHPFKPLPKSIQYSPHSGPPTNLTCHHLHSSKAPPILASLIQQFLQAQTPVIPSALARMHP